MLHSELIAAVKEAAAIRRVRRLQPAGGSGDKLFPPTYPGDEKDDPARHVFEKRRIEGQSIECVLLDSAQSQANREEEALHAAISAGEITLPRIEVDFGGTAIADVGLVGSLTAPHRVYDAILRDSELDGVTFGQSDLGKSLRLANIRNASALFQHAPTALVFGAWNSTGEGGGLGAKFPRTVVSEIVGVGVEHGERTGSRIDPLGIRAAVTVIKTDDGRWRVAGDDKPGKGEKKLRPSEVNHGNIAPSVTRLGVTVDYALHTWVLSLAGLRRIHFAEVGATDVARAALAALALVALLETDAAGYALRSRCDLVPDIDAPDNQRGRFELVAADGTTTVVAIDRDGARELLANAVKAAAKAGLSMQSDPVMLSPSARLVELVFESRQLALGDVPDEADSPTT